MPSVQKTPLRTSLSMVFGRLEIGLTRVKPGANHHHHHHHHHHHTLYYRELTNRSHRYRAFKVTNHILCALAILQFTFCNTFLRN